MTTTFTICATATQDGYGSGMHRVIGLSGEERRRAMSGERVFYRAARISHRGTRGTYWRVVKADGTQLYPRVPTPQEISVNCAQPRAPADALKRLAGGVVRLSDASEISNAETN